jgi:hypothetical protein
VTETTFYKVSWTTESRSSESRIFPEWDSAVEFYDGIIEDTRTEKATLVEVSEKEIRCHEHEHRRT